MSTATKAQFEHLLSSRAQIGRGRPGAWPAGATKYEFGGGKPDPDTFPLDDIVEATRKMMPIEGKEAMTYGEPSGYRGLREVLVEKFTHFEGLQTDPDDFILTNGSSHALSLAISSFVDIGDAVICEAPTFSGTLNTFRRHGTDLRSVPIDDGGIVIDGVRAHLENLKREGKSCKLIYTMPNFHNPAGPSAPLERRKALIALAQEYGTLILEDDAYGELRFEGEFIPSIYALDDSGCVIRSGTLSKILGAGMRLGWLLAPRDILATCANFNFGGGVAPFTSRVAAYYMREHMADHVPLLVDVYRNKRDAMLQGLWEVLEGSGVAISKPAGGFFIWIKLPAGTDTAKIGKLARESGVGYVPGMAFMPNGGGEDCIRLAFSYESEEKCHAGARHLALAIHEALP